MPKFRTRREESYLHFPLLPPLLANCAAINIRADRHIVHFIRSLGHEGKMLIAPLKTMLISWHPLFLGKSRQPMLASHDEVLIQYVEKGLIWTKRGRFKRSIGVQSAHGQENILLL